MEKEIIEKFANEISQHDLVYLIELVSNRLGVFVSDNSTFYDLSRIEPASINGSLVQINLE